MQGVANYMRTPLPRQYKSLEEEYAVPANHYKLQQQLQQNNLESNYRGRPPTNASWDQLQYRSPSAGRYGGGRYGNMINSGYTSDQPVSKTNLPAQQQQSMPLINSFSTSNLYSDNLGTQDLRTDQNVNLSSSAPRQRMNQFDSMNSSYVTQPLSVSTSLGNLGGRGVPPPSDNLSNVSSSHQDPNQPANMNFVYTQQHDPYIMPLPVLQREYETLRREYESVLQKLNSTMNSIKTFWSPELKRERTARKEEGSKQGLLNEQLRLAAQENQRQALLIRQLQDELQCQFELHRTIRDTDLHSVSREEYDAMRLERDRLHREMALLRNTVREFEVQFETQRQTLNARDDSIKKLLDLLQNKGIITKSAACDRLELEQYRSRVIELDNRSRHLENLVQLKEQDVHTLQDECMNASAKLSQLQRQYESLRLMPSDDVRDENMFGLLESKDAHIAHLQKQIAMLDQEVLKFQDEQQRKAPREFTDKSVTDREYSELKLRVEKFEMELKHKLSECSALQTRLSASEDQCRDLRQHLELLKESMASKDQQLGHLQTDIETLRSKLENKNETIEQKTQQASQVQQARNKLQQEISELQEQLKTKEGKLSSLQRKLDHVEELLKEKEQQLEITKARAAASPSVIQQQQFQDQLEELLRERERLLNQFREQRDRIEQERMQEMELHRQEVAELKTALDSLQKELHDRQILIESQSSKIGELSKDVDTFKASKAAENSADSGTLSEVDRLREELDQARMEVERLLQMVQSVDQDKHQSSIRVRELEEQLKDARGKYSSLKRSQHADRKRLQIMDDSSKREESNEEKLRSTMVQKELRIEELEEALRESVSITAERELAVAQQKQLNQQTEYKANQYREELEQMNQKIEELHSQLTALKAAQQERDQVIRGMRQERKKHLEEVMELKQEALLAAISEKDAHIALLETNQGANNKSEELHTLRKHKDKLMRKLKDENEKRVKLLSELNRDGDLQSTPLATELKASPADQIFKAVRFVELQNKKLHVFINHLVESMMDLEPAMLRGLRAPYQYHTVDFRLLRTMPRQQMLVKLAFRELDCGQLQRYANKLLLRLSQVHPRLARRAMRLLESFSSRYY